MRRDNFGKLVITLREERRDFHTYQPWSRKKLEKETGISYNVLSKLETGKKVNLPEEDLIALANAFQLSTGERREFINAANGVDTKHLVSEQNTSESVLEHCRTVVETIRAPALIVDNFYDIIACNMAAVYFFNLQDTDYFSWHKAPYPQNIVAALLNPEVIEPGTMRGASVQEFLVRNVMNFRIRTLPHRHKAYFKDLLGRLFRLNSTFESLWIETQYAEQDRFLGYPFTVKTEEWGLLRVIGSTMTFPTETGQLEIIIENPADKHTRNALPELVRQAGQKFIMLSQWPKTPPYYSVDKNQE